MLTIAIAIALTHQRFGAIVLAFDKAIGKASGQEVKKGQNFLSPVRKSREERKEEPVLLNKPLQCPYCGSDALARDGHANGKQKYLCHTCRRRHTQKSTPPLPVQSGAMKE